MIEANEVSVSIGRKRIIADVDFEIRPGEMAAIVGPTGSGKTTFLKAVTGDLSYSGRISINGRDIAAMKPWQAPGYTWSSVRTAARLRRSA